MQLSGNKRTAHACAADLLSKKDNSLLRYACVELRGCLEFIAYEKLLVYSSRLPKSLRKWQPPQFFKALLQIEPDASRSFVLRVSPQHEPERPGGEWRTLGTHRSLDLRSLNETYHKLGRFLHAPFPDEQNRTQSPDPASLRSFLEEVLRELQPVIASNLDSSLAEVVQFKCIKCDEPMACNAQGLRITKKAICLDPNCGAEHDVLFDDAAGTVSFVLDASKFTCLQCEEAAEIENRLLKIGYAFACPKCHTKHMIATRQWGYGIVETK